MRKILLILFFSQMTLVFLSCSNKTERVPPEISGFVYKGSHNDHLYYISENELTWDEADSIISNTEGHMVTISSSAENEFLLKILDEVTDAPNNGWIGLTDRDNEGEFKWVNNESLAFTNWNEGEPNDEAFGGCKNDPAENAVCSEDYVHMHNSWHHSPGSWNDAPSGYFKWKALLEID